MATGSAVVDFGSTPGVEASVEVTGQTALAPGDHVEAFVMRETTVDNGLEQHDALATFGRIVCQNDAAADKLTIFVRLLAGLATGQFNVRWVYAS